MFELPLKILFHARLLSIKMVLDLIPLCHYAGTKAEVFREEGSV